MRFCTNPHGYQQRLLNTMSQLMVSGDVVPTKDSELNSKAHKHFTPGSWDSQVFVLSAANYSADKSQFSHSIFSWKKTYTTCQACSA